MLVYAGANVKATTRLGRQHAAAHRRAQRQRRRWSTCCSRPAPTPRAPTATGTTPLMLAAASGNVEAVKALLAAGADVNAREQSMEQTALMFAAAFDRVEAMKALVARGADVKADDQGRRTWRR